jgi:hypothetical protein
MSTPRSLGLSFSTFFFFAFMMLGSVAYLHLYTGQITDGHWSPEEKSSNTEIHEKFWLDFRVRYGLDQGLDRIRIGHFKFEELSEGLSTSLEPNFSVRSLRRNIRRCSGNFFANFCFKKPLGQTGNDLRKAWFRVRILQNARIRVQFQ